MCQFIASSLPIQNFHDADCRAHSVMLLLSKLIQVSSTMKMAGCGMNFLKAGWMNVYRTFHNYSNDGVTYILGVSVEMDKMRVSKSFDG